ncbi:hypothetical protein RA8CHR_02590 [Variovorax sp. RA8]|nr:hypothetical protein RA8CHR_02590 [Variovorax sp. RA8]
MESRPPPYLVPHRMGERWRADHRQAAPKQRGGRAAFGQKFARNPTFRLRPGSGASGKAVVVRIEVAL